MKVAIYVQHLLGSGHLVRMQILARVLHNQGVDITLVTGGLPSGVAPAAREYPVIQLPPIRTLPGDFSNLLDHNKRKIDETFKGHRRQLLIDTVVGLNPDILVVETWPFGRRQMEFELIPLLDHLGGFDKPPAIVSSIRDVLQVRAPKRRQQTLDYLERYVSMVLVHGDPAFIDLGQSFAEADRIATPVRYTGYIFEPEVRKPRARSDPSGEILVSAGGGAAGRPLLEVALEAARKDQRQWRILTGSNPGTGWLSGALNSPDSRITVEPNRPDFFELLCRCSVSVSQFGYNTALELIHAESKAVVVPYAADGETEQAMRADRFARRGLCEVISEDGLSPRYLLDAIDRVSSRPPTPSTCPAMDGAARTVELLYEHFQQPVK